MSSRFAVISTEHISYGFYYAPCISCRSIVCSYDSDETRISCKYMAFSNVGTKDNKKITFFLCEDCFEKYCSIGVMEQKVKDKIFFDESFFVDIEDKQETEIIDY